LDNNYPAGLKKFKKALKDFRGVAAKLTGSGEYLLN
jgi:hypothetical protein